MNLDNTKIKGKGLSKYELLRVKVSSSIVHNWAHSLSVRMQQNFLKEQKAYGIDELRYTLVGK
ncbi:hypothetical protein NUACC21_77190 [Scytonema sp. NUACC21]